MVPLLEAECDRDMVRRMEAVKAREAAIMPADWKAGDLKAPISALGDKPVYNTDRYVQPSLVFLPKEEPSFIGAQFWRGTKVFTKVTYFNRTLRTTIVKISPRNTQLDNKGFLK